LEEDLNFIIPIHRKLVVVEVVFLFKKYIELDLDLYD
jgi:hypothetical protein